MSTPTFEKRSKVEREKAGITDWSDNASFASYSLAAFNDIDKLRNDLGHENNDKIFSNYRKPIRHEIAEKWWTIASRGAATVIKWQRKISKARNDEPVTDAVIGSFVFLRTLSLIDLARTSCARKAKKLDPLARGVNVSRPRTPGRSRSALPSVAALALLKKWQKNAKNVLRICQIWISNPRKRRLVSFTFAGA